MSVVCKLPLASPDCGALQQPALFQFCAKSSCVCQDVTPSRLSLTSPSVILQKLQGYDRVVPLHPGRAAELEPLRRKRLSLFCPSQARIFAGCYWDTEKKGPCLKKLIRTKTEVVLLLLLWRDELYWGAARLCACGLWSEWQMRSPWWDGSWERWDVCVSPLKLFVKSHVFLHCNNFFFFLFYAKVWSYFSCQAPDGN